MSNAYLQTPALAGDKLIFVTDDDLWSVSRFGGIARRLTNDEGRSLSPKISTDKTKIAYLANHHGQADLYQIPIQGGMTERITYHGLTNLGEWIDNQRIYVGTNHDSMVGKLTHLKEVNTRSKEMVSLPYGPASCLVKNKKKQVLGRNIGNPARWKRYRGGTAGTLWVDSSGNHQFKQILKKLKTNLANPLWINDRIFFISDHEGIGNIYSCRDNGTNLKRHTNQDEFYVRSFSYDENLIAYQAGGDLFLLDLKSNTSHKIDIEVPSSFNQAKPRIEYAEDFLQDFALSEGAHEILINTRGKLMVQAPWGEAPIFLGREDSRYKFPLFVKDHYLAVELDREQEETLVLFDEEQLKRKVIASKQSWGKIYGVTPSPNGDKVALYNNRCELWIVDIPSGRHQLVEQNKFHFFQKVSWSPCGHYLAFESGIDARRMAIKLYNLNSKKSTIVIPPINRDSSPEFSPCGKYLYFIGIREFHPLHNETHFEYAFPFATRPYAICLAKDTPSPLEQFHNYGDDDDENENAKDKKGKKKKITHIDWDGLSNRIVPLPVELGGYTELFAAKDKLLFTKHKNQGISPYSSHRDDSTYASLYCYCFKENKKELYQPKVLAASSSHDFRFLMIFSDDRLRIISTENKPTDGESNSKKDGWIDLERSKFRLDPKKEWAEMYREAWILQREHFWTKDMSKVDWQQVYRRYLPILEKVHTRAEFSDLMWEMQGELGTSHCYEMGGDYHRRPPAHQNGYFAASFKTNSRTKKLEITSMAKGNSWIKSERSPLLDPEISLQIGDQIIGINGIEVSTVFELERECEGKAGQKINLEVKRKGAKDNEFLPVVLLNSNADILYRDWVNANRDYVHKKSKGKLGYIHIPDMYIKGYSEFCRQFVSESQYQGLVVDVRFNGGGHISQHILKMLSQKTLGFDQTRYFGNEAYPMYSVNGPMVCLTNELAGSDGDIFSHCFKLMKLGKLIGKRTWGGVVGIWPRITLNDGSMTSQPEFSFWFKDVGWQVENYGTDPDIEVEILPQDWMKNKDTQLDKAIEVCLKDAKRTPPLVPDLNKRPSLKLPKLPK